MWMENALRSGRTVQFSRSRHMGRQIAAVRASLIADGWAPALIEDPPRHVYPPHRHPEAKLLAFLTGEMEVTAGEQTFRCAPGDQLVIPGDVEHAARVGPQGCTYFWSEQRR
jgi:mannose-6-phosphate isomerase-like protein (cupin superfamily)